MNALNRRLYQYRESQISFWWLHTIGWIIYVLLFYYHVVMLGQPMGPVLIPTVFEGIRSNFLLRIVVLFIPAYFYLILLRQIYQRLYEYANRIWLLTLLILGGSILGALLCYVTMEIVLNLILGLPVSGLLQFRPAILYIQLWISIIFVIWSGLYFGIKYWLDWSRKKNITEELLRKGQKEQLRMLRYQLNPHFLFNALNSIRALIREDKHNAKSAITDLSAYLRYTFIGEEEAEVSLQREMEVIQHYYALEKRRFGDRLQMKFEIAPAAEQQTLVNFLVQPLVENAVKYGMRTSPMPLRVGISAEMSDTELRIEVCNTGHWMSETERNIITDRGTGTGLRNVKTRLQNCYGDRHRFRISEQDGKVCVGFAIRMEGGK